MWSKLILLLFISSCSIVLDKDKKNDTIVIQELKPIQNTKVNCDTKSLTQLELTKCEMKSRLLELKY